MNIGSSYLNNFLFVRSLITWSIQISKIRGLRNGRQVLQFINLNRSQNAVIAHRLQTIVIYDFLQFKLSNWIMSRYNVSGKLKNQYGR